MGVFAVDIRAKHHELFAAQTTEHIGAPQPMTNALTHDLQHPIAHRVPVLVIDPFEVVDIEHDHRQLATAALDPGHFGGQPLLEIAAVIDAGQGVGDRQCAQLFFHALQVGDVRDIAMPQHTATG